MIRLHMVPAGHGDCLWIEYGDAGAPRRVLIDGGTAGTYKKALLPKLQQIPAAQRQFELLVITHIDADHIAGALELMKDKANGFSAKEIWFNGFRHLPDEAPQTLGPVQGEILTDLLVQPGINWNGTFAGAAVALQEDAPPPRIQLEGGLTLTLLSPTPQCLTDLKPKWEKEVIKAGLDPNKEREALTESPEGFQLLGGELDVEELASEAFSEDSSVANGSCIALLAEFEGRRLLLAGDAHPGVIQAGLDRLGVAGKLPLDAIKLPHHGSKANISNDFLESVACDKYLFSSNGAYFKHPDREAVARVIKWGGNEPQLIFNYDTKYNNIWDNDRLRKKYGYQTLYPDSKAAGVTLEWD